MLPMIGHAWCSWCKLTSTQVAQLICALSHAAVCQEKVLHAAAWLVTFLQLASLLLSADDE